MKYNTTLNFTSWNNAGLTATFGKDADTLSCCLDIVAAVAEGRNVDIHPLLLPVQTAAQAAMDARSLAPA